MVFKYAVGVFLLFFAIVWAVNAFFLYVLLEGDAGDWERNRVFGGLPVFQELWRIPMNYITGLSAQIAKAAGFSHGKILAGVNVAIVIAFLGLSATAFLLGKSRRNWPRVGL